MNYYYVDSSLSSNGDGSLNTPFNSINSIFSATIAFPFTVLIKSGTVEKTNVNQSGNSLLLNSSSEQSFITKWGLGTNPVLVQKDGSKILFDVMLSNTVVSHIDFWSNDESQSVNMVHVTADPLSGNDANVYVDCCNFHTPPQCDSGDALWALQVMARADIQKRTNKFGARNCNFYETTRGVQILGNYNWPTGTEDDNSLEKWDSYGAVALNCGFVNVKQDGAVLNFVSSKTTDEDDDYTSKIQGSKYSYTRWDYKNRYTVAFWTVFCKGAMILDCDVRGQQGLAADKLAYDFDVMCQNCIVRRCTSSNNGGGFILAIAYGDNPTEKPKPTTESNYDWYVTKQWGNNGNLVEDCVSYNDGIYRNQAFGPNSSKIKIEGWISGLMIKNLKVYDTQSRGGGFDILDDCKYSSSDLNGGTVCAISDSSFNYKRKSVDQSFYFNSDTASSNSSLISVNNSSLWSQAMGDSGLEFNGVTASNPSYSDPGLMSFPDSSPSDLTKLLA